MSSTVADLFRLGLEQATGEKIKRVWWQPLRRGAEMQGPAGGWMYEGESGEDCLGTDMAMAMTMIVNIAKIRARQESDTGAMPFGETF